MLYGFYRIDWTLSGPIGGKSNWWSQAGSNRRPPACKAGALPAELWPQNQDPCETLRTFEDSPTRTRQGKTIHAIAHQCCRLSNVRWHFNPHALFSPCRACPICLSGRSRRFRHLSRLPDPPRCSGKIANHLVGLGGFEPPTSPLSGVRSNQLSYRPKKCLSNSEKPDFQRPWRL
jgi:hypothetical protein